MERRYSGLGTGAWLSVQLHVQGLCRRSWVKGRSWSAARRMGMQNFPSLKEGLSCMVVSVRLKVSRCSGMFRFCDCISWDPLGGRLDLGCSTPAPQERGTSLKDLLVGVF